MKPGDDYPDFEVDDDLDGMTNRELREESLRLRRAAPRPLPGPERKLAAAAWPALRRAAELRSMTADAYRPSAAGLDDGTAERRAASADRAFGTVETFERLARIALTLWRGRRADADDEAWRGDR